MRGPRKSSTRHHPEGWEDEKARETTNTFSGSLPSEGRNPNDPGHPNLAPNPHSSLTHPLQKFSHFGDLYFLCPSILKEPLFHALPVPVSSMKTQYQAMELRGGGVFPKAPSRISAPFYYWAGWTKQLPSPPLRPDSELQCGVKSRISLSPHRLVHEKESTRALNAPLRPNTSVTPSHGNSKCSTPKTVEMVPHF